MAKHKRRFTDAKLAEHLKQLANKVERDEPLLDDVKLAEAAYDLILMKEFGAAGLLNRVAITASTDRSHIRDLPLMTEAMIKSIEEADPVADATVLRELAERILQGSR